MKITGHRAAVQEYKRYNGKRGLRVDIMVDTKDGVVWADTMTNNSYMVYNSHSVKFITGQIYRRTGECVVNERTVKMVAQAICEEAERSEE